jgi:transcriptional regulator with XRE-family HTH domain
MAATGGGADALTSATQAFVDAIRSAADANFIPRKRIAAILGIGQSTLANWLNNYAPPDLERLHNNSMSVDRRLQDLENACGVAPGSFVTLYRAVASARNQRRTTRPAAPEIDQYQGLTRVHRSFPVAYFSQVMCSARRVRMVNTWFPNLRQLEEGLRAVVSAGGDVEITMLNPFGSAAISRASTLGHKPGRQSVYSIASEIRDSLRHLAGIAASFDYPGRLNVYLSPEIPALAIYQADDYILAGIFLHTRLAVDGPQLEVAGAGSPMADVIEAELNKLHDDSMGPVELPRWEGWLNSNL